MVSEAQTANRLQNILLTCISLELRPKTSETVSSAYNEGRLFQTVGIQHEIRRAAMFVDEDCVDSRSDVDDLRTRSFARYPFVTYLSTTVTG